MLNTRVLRSALALRAVPLVPLIRHSLPGRGFHSGASFPISRQARNVARRR